MKQLFLLSTVSLFVSIAAFASGSEDIDAKVENILKQMTLEEKIDYIGGTGFSIRPIERLGLPEIIMSDGPMGCRGFGKAAAFPAGISLAATWNVEMAKEIGSALGEECRARGVHIILAPGVNIYRSPLCGRNFEYLGEDPYLSSHMVVPLIQSIQSQGVLATVKHYCCNNQEWDRNNISSEVDERTLHEIYLPAFKAAVQKAQTGCIMTAYNLVNGIHCTEHDYLNNQILRKKWGFKGINMSDWGATHNAVNAANNGLDLEMPTGEYMNRANLLPAIQDGRVKESTIDEKVRRILRTIISAGFLDRPQRVESIPLDNPNSNKVALKGAREGIVLLKNENNALPLDRNTIKSVAVIGPNAHPAVYCAGGSAFTTTFHAVSILDGIKSVAGDSIEVYSPILDFGFANGAKMEVYDNKDFRGNPVVISKTDHIDYVWTNTPPEGYHSRTNYAVRWTGKIDVDKAGRYRLSTRYDDGVRIWVDGKLIFDDWTEHLVRNHEQVVDLSEGEHDVKIEYFQAGGEAIIKFEWRPYKELDQEIKDLAKYDAVVYCAGFNSSTEGEGFDRPFDLPKEQVDYMSALGKAHPRVIVTINSGGGVGWDGWLENVPAVIQAWYSGQQIGRAVAEIIFGDINPSGKLPASFEKKFEDNPSSPYYHINDNGKTPYGEKIFVGYRGFDKNKVEPQFCFGHGLSYTTFEFSNLEIGESRKEGTRTIEVSCDVKNTGKRSGAEVAQLYLGDRKCSVERPIKELKGYNKLFLAPGETKTAIFTLSEEDLAFYDINKHDWKAEPGRFDVWVGSSSRELPLHGEFDW